MTDLFFFFFFLFLFFFLFVGIPFLGRVRGSPYRRVPGYKVLTVEKAREMDTEGWRCYVQHAIDFAPGLISEEDQEICRLHIALDNAEAIARFNLESLDILENELEDLLK